MPVNFNPGYYGFRAGALAARAIPGPAVPFVTRMLGRFGARTMADRRRIVERNLRRVHGTSLTDEALHSKVVETFDSYARYWVESFRLPGTSAGDLEQGMRVDGFEAIDDALAAGRGAILALPHLGGWEWAAFWLAEVRNTRITAVVEPVEPPELAEWFLGMRRTFGINAVNLGPSAGTECVRALKANQILCLLCDRDIAGGGVEVEFFGERTTIPAGPVTLALRSGAPLIPAAVYFDGRGHHAIARPPVPAVRSGSFRADVSRVSQDLVAELEALIRLAPEQWHLMQPNWPSDHEAA